MIFQLLLLFGGFTALWIGGNWLVDGSSAIAKRFNISPFIIGLTLVAFGTSAPELAVNILASLKGQSDITMGNILGSNISNILLILGISSIVYPIAVHDKHIKIDIPTSIMCTIGLWILIIFPKEHPFIISKLDGIVLLIGFVLFLAMVILPKNDPSSMIQDAGSYVASRDIPKTLLGLVLLPIGGKFATEPAIYIAQYFGLSEIFIALFTIAIGTSLPELATSVSAALKKETDIAMGNVIGSNVFNILLILGISSTIHPVRVDPGLWMEISIIIAASILIIPLVRLYRPYQLSRWQGVFFVCLYIAYLIAALYRG